MCIRTLIRLNFALRFDFFRNCEIVSLMMKHLRVLLPAICISFLAVASSHAADAWNTDYQVALDQAKKENKMVLVDFTGSTWCPPCIKLAGDTFAKPEFKKFAEDNLALVELDFPRDQSQTPAANLKLAEQYGVQGFPTLVLLNSEGKELDRHVGYLPGGPEAFIAWVDAAKKK